MMRNCQLWQKPYKPMIDVENLSVKNPTEVSDRIQELIDAIKEAQRRFECAKGNKTQAILELGQLCEELREVTPDGLWKSTADNHLPFTLRHAQSLIRIWQNRELAKSLGPNASMTKIFKAVQAREVPVVKKPRAATPEILKTPEELGVMGGIRIAEAAQISRQMADTMQAVTQGYRANIKVLKDVVEQSQRGEEIDPATLLRARKVIAHWRHEQTKL